VIVEILNHQRRCYKYGIDNLRDCQYYLDMVTFAEIKAFRLDISDPADYIDIISVANPAALPSEPNIQTAYYVESSGVYVGCDKTSGATADDYEVIQLLLSDARISTWLASYSHDEAVVYGLKAIIKQLGRQISLKRTGTGTEDTEFTALIDMYDYYKGILAMQQKEVEKAAGTNTGIWGSMEQPEIAGGNL
jgi:hypothetical protein